ncbi:P-loop containing nucleoside triphosphate hydrolase protein [Mycena sanguinolenta]|nr:P-loop containing nucleoside triphosphate hydrolase protein [Mycena sanguinolenta]
MPGSPSKHLGFRRIPFIHHATMAAATLKQLSETHSIPQLTLVAGLALLVVETVQSVNTRKEECAALVQQIHRVLCAMIDLVCTMNTSQFLAPVLFDSMATFSQTLQKIQTFIRAQQSMGILERFLRKRANTSQLENCKMSLKHALDILSIEVRRITVSHVADFEAATESKHRELLKLIATKEWFEGSVFSFTSSISSSRTLHSSLSSLSLLLPGAPQIFHGRESELEDVVHGLMQDTARVAILGPGGIGKTTLAKSALHHPDIVRKYAVRYFVPCDSAESVENLAFAVASALGLELTGKLFEAVIQHLSEQSSCLVVLDNFETPWEPIEMRSKVENFLAALGDFPHIALLVTMRGQERPLKTRWTRPFLPALKPLSSNSALKIFMDVADAEDEDASQISELLALTGNLPLAVTIMASITALDGCESVLARWKTESVSFLSDGLGRGSNLETSLRLSLSSPRMASSPGALQLLSLLSLLPDGILDPDLSNSASHISDLHRSRSTLLRTSLAYIDAERLKVLAPVRELVRKLQPPPYTLVRPLCSRWASLLELWRTYQMPSGGLVQQLARNAGNFNALLKYALDEVEFSDLQGIVYAVFYLDAFTTRTYGESSPLMANISAHIDCVDDNGLRGYYIWHRFQETSIPRAEAPHLIAQGSKFFQLAGDSAGQCFNML